MTAVTNKRFVVQYLLNPSSCLHGPLFWSDNDTIGEAAASALEAKTFIDQGPDQEPSLIWIWDARHNSSSKIF